MPNPVDKIAHFCAYTVLGFLLGKGFPGRGLWKAALAVAVGYALVDEYHQAFVPGRDPSPFDFLADVLGAAAGVALATLIGKRDTNPAS